MTYCSKKPDMSLIQATTGVAEFMISVSGPGKTLNLNWRFAYSFKYFPLERLAPRNLQRAL